MAPCVELVWQVRSLVTKAMPDVPQTIYVVPLRSVHFGAVLVAVEFHSTHTSNKNVSFVIRGHGGGAIHVWGSSGWLRQQQSP